MASFVTYTGNGVLTNYAVPFSYIDRSHVHAFLDGVETTAFTWFDGSTIAFDAAPGNGVKIRIERKTPDDAPLADFTNGQVLVEQDLDTATLQALFVAEEAKDRANQSIIPDQGGNFDLDGKRLTNVGAPVDPNDAATKAYADQTLTQAQTFASQAQAARDAALDAQAAAEAAFDGFDDRYLGAKTSNPTLDNDGNALIDGALYWNTTANEFRVYDLGTASWIPVGVIPHSHVVADLSDASANARTFLQASNYADMRSALDVYSKSEDDAKHNHNTRRQATIEFTFDGGGATLQANKTIDVEVPFDCAIQSYTLIAKETGSIVIDLWRSSYANFPPTVADTITASAKPTLSSASKAQDSTLTGWAKFLGKGHIIRANIDSVSTITQAVLSLNVLKSNV